MSTDSETGYVMNIAGQNYMVEGDRIQFLDSRFYRTANGYVPSVTTILEAYPKGAAYFEWLKRHGQDADDIRDEAGRRGSIVHGLTEIYDTGGEVNLMNEDGTPRYKLKEWAMLERYVDFRKRHPARIHAIELNMVSEALGYAGTLDRVMTIGGITYLIDIKTSAAVHPHYWLQQAAYERLLVSTGMIAGLFPDGPVPEIKLAILWLNAATRTHKDGAIQGPGWQLIEQKEPTADLMQSFEHTRALWMRENRNLAPKMTTYKLSHKH